MEELKRVLSTNIANSIPKEIAWLCTCQASILSLARMHAFACPDACQIDSDDMDAFYAMVEELGDCDTPNGGVFTDEDGATYLWNKNILVRIDADGFGYVMASVNRISYKEAFYQFF